MWVNVESALQAVQIRGVLLIGGERKNADQSLRVKFKHTISGAYTFGFVLVFLFLSPISMLLSLSRIVFTYSARSIYNYVTAAIGDEYNIAHTSSISI